jgi:hypothetical protein
MNADVFSLHVFLKLHRAVLDPVEAPEIVVNRALTTLADGHPALANRFDAASPRRRACVRDQS